MPTVPSSKTFQLEELLQGVKLKIGESIQIVVSESLAGAKFVVYHKDGGNLERASGQLTANRDAPLILHWEIDDKTVTGVGITYGKNNESIRDVTAKTQKEGGKWKGSFQITPTHADINTPEGTLYMGLIVEPGSPDVDYGAVTIRLHEMSKLAITEFEASTVDGSQIGLNLEVPRKSTVYLAWNTEGATDVEIEEDAGNGRQLIAKVSAQARTYSYQAVSASSLFYLRACNQDRFVESPMSVHIKTGALEDLITPPVGNEELPPWKNTDGAGTWLIPITPKALTEFIGSKLKLEKKDWQVPAKDPWAKINLSASLKPSLAIKLTTAMAKKFHLDAPPKPAPGSTVPELTQQAELKTSTSLFEGIEANFKSTETWDVADIMGKGTAEWGVKANFNPLGFIKWASTTDYDKEDKVSKFLASKIEDTVADLSLWYKLMIDAPAQWGPVKGIVRGSLQFDLSGFKLSAGSDIEIGQYGFKLPNAAAMGELGVTGSFVLADVTWPMQVEGMQVELVGNVTIELKGSVQPDWAAIIERQVVEVVKKEAQIYARGFSDIALRFALSDAGLCLGAPLAVGAAMLWVFHKQSQAWDDFTQSMKTLHEWQEQYPNGIRDALISCGTQKPTAEPPVTPYDSGLKVGLAFWDQYYKMFWDNLANGSEQLFPEKAALMALPEPEKRKIVLTTLYTKGYFEKTVADARSSAEYVVRARIYLGYCAAHRYPSDKSKRDLTFRSIYSDIVCPSDYTKFVSPGFPAEVLESALRDAWYLEHAFQLDLDALEYNLEALIPHVLPEEFTEVQQVVQKQPDVIKDAQGLKLPEVTPKMNRTLGNVKPEKTVLGKKRYDPGLPELSYKENWPWPPEKVYSEKVHNLEGSQDTLVDVQMNRWYAENGAPYPWPALYKGQFHALYPLKAAKKLVGKA